LKTAFVARWLARLAATAITALFITFLVGEGTPDLRDLTDQELAGFGALFLMIIGSVVAWRRDLLGALILIAGYAAFALIESGWPPIPFLVYPLAALLLLISAIIRWTRRRRQPAAATGTDPLPGPAPAA
jgi:hypothetical protein